jgi:gas vesicle protein
MTDSPDAIRAHIERTRGELGADVDALADKVSPSKIAERQTRRVRAVFGSVRNRVMGAADDAGNVAESVTADIAGGVANAAHDVKAKAEGNPLAVGLIAFGAGLLMASLIPASRKEREVAATVKEQAQPLIDEATDVAKEIVDDLKEPAHDAVGAVADRAKEAAHAVADEASEAGEGVKKRAQEAKDAVSDS